MEELKLLQAKLLIAEIQRRLNQLSNMYDNLVLKLEKSETLLGISPIPPTYKLIADFESIIHKFENEGKEERLSSVISTSECISSNPQSYFNDDNNWRGRRKDVIIEIFPKQGEDDPGTTLYLIHGIDGDIWANSFEEAKTILKSFIPHFYEIQESKKGHGSYFMKNNITGRWIGIDPSTGGYPCDTDRQFAKRFTTKESALKYKNTMRGDWSLHED